MFLVNYLTISIFASIILIINLSCFPIYVNGIEIGEVKCTQNVQWKEELYQAHENCRKMMNNGGQEEDFKSYPRNATLEEFDFDDKCHGHCVYKAMGILTKDDQLPDKKETVKIFTKGKKVSDESFSKFTAIWDNCLDKAGKIAKSKKFDECKTVALHDFCFFKTSYYDTVSLEIAC